MIDSIGRRGLGAAGTALAMAAAGRPAHAQARSDLRIGAQVEPTSIDPHFANVDTNNAMALHFFTPLVIRNERLEPQPGLATSWRMLDETTWEFRLREGVRFHDGSELTAEDVAFSIRRAPAVPGSPSSLSVYLRHITAVEVIDRHTIRLRTAEIFPLMQIFMGTFVILSRRAAEGVTTEEFNTGRGMVGTGPYRFTGWQRGERLTMERFADYWGPAPDIEHVTFRFIPNAAARLSALLAGDVDMIDFVPIASMDVLARRNDLRLSRGVTNRLIYLHIEHARPNAPFVTDRAGQPFTDRGPLQDARVRRAISMAIDRRAIAARVMDGASEPTSQVMPAGAIGHVPDLPVEAHDPAGSRRLLTEAGYPNGFAVTMHVPRNRYVNDVRAMEAIAQMLTRIGIEVRLETVPVQTFFDRAARREFSLFMIGFGVVTGEPSSFLSLVLQTFDAQARVGAGNRGRYSNPEFDRLLIQALRTPDDTAREDLLRQATRVAIADQALIPLHHQVHVWAMRADLDHTPRTDEYTLAQDVRRRA
jgi:peptide/nickel transport system substrate-binding protein